MAVVFSNIESVEPISRGKSKIKVQKAKPQRKNQNSADWKSE
jgi:hypothetical protein